MVMFIHRRIRSHRSHAGATISTTVRIDDTSRRPEHTLLNVAMQPGLQLTDLFPRPGVLQSRVRLFVDTVDAVVTRDAFLHTVAVQVAGAGRADSDPSADRFAGVQQTTPFLGRRV